jgi:NAD(P)H-dependent FMN reductase
LNSSKSAPTEVRHGNRLLVFCGSLSFRSDGNPAYPICGGPAASPGDDVELIDAKAIDLPILDRMYKEYPKGEAPERLEQLARKIREADEFVFVTQYNWASSLV